MRLSTNIVFIPLMYGGDLIPVDRAIANVIHWCAVDSNGDLFGYTHEPKLLSGHNLWTVDKYSYYFLGKVELDDDDLPWHALKWRVNYAAS